MRKFITDERTGLRYELVGDYYLIAGEDEPESRPIGVWGRRHLRYIRKHKVSLYAELLTTGQLNDYLADLNERAEAMFFSACKAAFRKRRRNGSSQSGKSNALGAENEQSAKRCNGNRFKRAYLPSEMTAIKKSISVFTGKPVDAGFLFSAMNRKRPTGCSILIAGGDGVVTAKRGLFWYVDGELLCFPVSGNVVDAVSNNHRRFWETLPHFLTGGMPYNYYPRGRVELRHGKAVVYLHSTLCTPEMDTRIHHAFLLPDEMQVSFKADGSRHYRSIQEEQEG